MASAERHLHQGHEGLASVDFKSQPFSLVYATRPDNDKGIPSRNVTLDFREGSFSLKPEFAAPLSTLCETLKIEAPHCDHDLPNFVRRCLYTVDEDTYREKPHFENEVIPVLFPNGDLEAHKVRKFLATAEAPEKADQCCEIKGTIDGKEESVHLHGPYQADNKTRLTLLALVGYKPAQELLTKLVERQPDLQGKPLEQTALAVSAAIVERKSHQEAEHCDHDHSDGESAPTIAKPLEKFALTETIPSHELGVWGQSLKTVTDAALSLTLMQDHMDAKTKKNLENTVVYRLGFSPDPRHLLPEEVTLNRACDIAIGEHLKGKTELIERASIEQVAKAVLLIRSVTFGEEELHHLTEKLQGLDQGHLEKGGVIEELQPTLNYTLKLAGNETTFSYSQILQVIALGMGIQAKNKGTEYTSEELKIIQLSSIFNDVGFTLSNFRSDSNPYIEQNPYLLKPGQPLQQFEQAASRSNPNALQVFKGVDAHSRGKDTMGLHGTIKMENGKLVQDLCPDHTQEVTEQLQQVEQITQQLTQQFMQAKMEMPLQPVPQQPLPPLYPPPYFVGANPNQLGGPFVPHSHMGNSFGASLSNGFSSLHSFSSSGSERSGANNSNRSHNSRSVDSVSHNNGNNRSNNNSGESHRPKPAEPVRRVLVHEVSSGGKPPAVLESMPITRKPEEASGRVFITSDANPNPQPLLTLVRDVPSGGRERASLGSVSTTKSSEQAARTAYVNKTDSVPLTLVKDTPSGGIDRSALRSIPTTSEHAEAARVAYVNNADTAPLTFIQSVKTGGKPKEAVRKVKKTTNLSQAAKTEYVNYGITRTFVRRVNSGGRASSAISFLTTDNPNEATSVSYVNSESLRGEVATPAKTLPVPNILPFSPRQESVISSPISQVIEAQPSNNNSDPEPSIQRFTTSTIDVGPRNPQPTKPNPNRSLNSGEAAGKTVSKPVEVPSITIGTNLSKAFEKVEEKQQKAIEATTQTVQSQRTKQAQQTGKQETVSSTETTQITQQEQSATVLGSTKQEETQTTGSQKVEAGEAFGNSIASEDKAVSAQQTSIPVSQTRQSRGSTNTTEAARITEIETPRGKVKIIEGGRTASVSSNVPQRTLSANDVSEEENMTVAAQGTDEQNEQVQATQVNVSVQKTNTKTAASQIADTAKVRQTNLKNAASLALTIDNEYLDFTNPHAIGDAFKNAWSQALAA